MIYSRHLLEEDEAPVQLSHHDAARRPGPAGRARRLAVGGFLTCALVAGAVSLARLALG